MSDQIVIVEGGDFHPFRRQTASERKEANCVRGFSYDDGNDDVVGVSIYLKLRHQRRTASVCAANHDMAELPVICRDQIRCEKNVPLSLSNKEINDLNSQ